MVKQIELRAVKASDVIGPDVRGDLINARKGASMSNGETSVMSGETYEAEPTV